MNKIKGLQYLDRLWEENGGFEYVSPPHHYTITFSAVIIPFVLLLTLICYCIDESVEKPNYGGEATQSSRTTRPDKLD